jgi:Leucine-rich repeat (LRR) protein
MRSSASQALHFATWGAEHGVTTAQLDRFRRALDSGERELDLSAIAVRAVPSFLRGEHMLHCLTLRFAADEYLHVDVDLLPRLRTLRIVRSNVRKLLISGKGELRVQQGARCELEVSDSTTLQEMKMRTNAFDTPHIRDLRRLCELDVSASRLRHLAVVNAPELERLDASMNPLHDRGLELSEVGRLARIRLALGRLERIPPAVLQVPALRELDLRGNRIAIVAPADFPRLLVSLNLSCNALLAVPGDVACQASLRDLRLEMNRIASLPDTIGAFRRLETLDLSHNCIRALPPTIGRCNLLRVLKLGANQLSWLPSEVCQLAALETLHLDHNALTALPEDIHRLARLASLQLQGNALASLPGRLDELPVRRLILSGNPFFSVPELLLRKLTCSGQPSFAALAALDLGDTRLSEVPEGLGF